MTAALPPERPPARAPIRTKRLFGLDWALAEHELTIHLACYKMGRTIEQGGLGKAAHFWEIVNLIWGPDNEVRHFIRNPWSERMLDAALEHKYLSVAGAASSGKSLFYAIYAIVNWLCDPAGTTVLITSTSLKESRGRIWADVEEWWNAAQRKFNDALPGKLVSSVGLIKLVDPTGAYDDSVRSGIHLIAGEKKKEKDTIGKLIGYKNRRFLFIADEMPELSAALMEATGNLDSSEKEWFQMIGIGNPNSIYDPHGQFSRPKLGWKSITPAEDEWETQRGFCIRFDAYKSPNILSGRVVYKWLPTQAMVDKKKEELGEDSLAFWRMWRGFWCPTGGTESVISEADIVGFDCENKVVKWDGKPTEVTFLDPGFTNGGDRSCAYFALFGKCMDTKKMVLLFTDYTLYFENTMDKKTARNYQVVRQWRDECVKRKISPRNAGFDDTGAASFGDIVHMEWSTDVLRVNFGGAATKTRVSAHDATLASDKWKNRVTEIWCSLREYIRGGQIRGISPDLGIELTARKMVSKKSGAGLKQEVEPKPVMRSRTGKSPDIGDAALGILDLLRTRFKFRAAQRIARILAANGDWKNWTKKKDFFGKNLQHLDRTV